MKRLFPLLALLSALPLPLAAADCKQHAAHTSHAAQAADAAKPSDPAHKAHAHGVDSRGDHAMGFSHQKTKHTFRLLKDGGAIEVRALDAKDAESLASIRGHLQHIAQLFTAGDFEKPQFIHGRVPDGVDVLKAKRDAVRYTYEALERGARVRITTKDAASLDAIHRFLRFQIDDHRTGDPKTVTE